MNFKKVLAGACAGAMVFGMCAMPAFAAIQDADGNGNYIVDVATMIGDADINDVYGVKVTFTEASVADMMANGGGGGFIFSTASKNWNQLQWCNGCGDAEGHDIQIDAETNSITRMEETPFFTAEDISGADGTYGQVALCQWWGGDIAIESIELLDKDGNVIDTEADDPIVQEPTVVECAYTDGKTPSYSYTVQNNVSTITADIVYAPDQEDGSFGFNDWCGNGVIVNHADGSKSYYQWGGAQVSWGWDADGDEVDDSVDGVNGETWLGTVVDRQATLTIPVEQGATVDFLCLGWDSYAGTQYTVAISGDVAGSEEDPSEEDPSEEQPSEEQPSEEDPSNNDPEPTPSNPDGDVAPLAGLAVVAVAALGAAVVSSKKKANA